MWRAIALGLLPTLVVAAGVRFGIERVWIAVLGYHVVCVAVPLLSRLSAADAGLRGAMRGRWVLASAGLSLVLAAGILFVGLELYRRGALPAAARGLLARIEPWAIVMAYSIGVNPFMEEYYWRGFLLPKTGIASGAVYFALMHFAGFTAFLRAGDAALLSLAPLAAGLLWGWMRRGSASLWPCILTHAAADAGILLLFDAIRRGV